MNNSYILLVIKIKKRYRVILFVVGAYLASWGVFFVTIYMSLLNMGYTYSDYLQFILTRAEVYNLIIGVIMMIFALFYKKTTRR